MYEVHILHLWVGGQLEVDLPMLGDWANLI